VRSDPARAEDCIALLDRVTTTIDSFAFLLFLTDLERVISVFDPSFFSHLQNLW
jgi:hypothetical protein